MCPKKSPGRPTGSLSKQHYLIWYYQAVLIRYDSILWKYILIPAISWQLWCLNGSWDGLICCWCVFYCLHSDSSQAILKGQFSRAGENQSALLSRADWSSGREAVTVVIKIAWGVAGVLLSFPGPSDAVKLEWLWRELCKCASSAPESSLSLMLHIAKCAR